MSRPKSDKLAIFIPSLHRGGAERMMVNLLRGAVALGIPVDLLVAKTEGPLLADVPPQVRIVDFNVSKLQHAIPKIALYLRRERPQGVVSRMTHANLAILAGRLIAGLNIPVVVIEAANFTALLKAGEVKARTRSIARWLYPRANQIVGVSAGVARDLEHCLGMEEGCVRVIYNPVVDARLLTRAAETCPHPWFAERKQPVLMTAGRLVPVKDHATLLRAFAILRRLRPARMVIFGEGDERGRLEALRRELGLEADVDLPGSTQNPYAAMSRASLFVLSSRSEGLPNVLIEALACGCPVVSTDCPSGPNEVLDHGRYGLLVPVEEPESLAAAMLASLERHWDRDVLRRRGAEFSLAKSLGQFLEALNYPIPSTQPAVAA